MPSAFSAFQLTAQDTCGPGHRKKKSWTIDDPNEITFYSKRGGFILNNGNSKCTQDSFVLRDTGSMLAGNTKKIELRNCVTRLEQKRIQSSSLAWKY